MGKKGLILLSYLTLYVVWGSTYFFIKMAVETIPPFYVLGLRFTGGGILLLALAWFAGRLRARPTLRQLGASFLLGALLLVGGNGLITIAEKKVDSYIVALVIASTPMVVGFYDRVLFGKRIGAVRLSGIAVGMAGVGLLLYDGHSLATALSPEILTVIAGVACWALATSMGHRLKPYPDTMANSGIQMLLMGPICLVVALLLYAPPAQIVPQVSLPSALGLAYLTVVGSLAFAAFTYLIAHEPAVRVASYSLVNPVFATLLGLLVGDETAVPLLAAGLPLVLIGVTLMLYGESLVGWWRRRRLPCPPD